MSYTSPSNSDSDFVRSLIGDTSNVSSTEAFTDQDIIDHLAAERLQGDGKRYLTAATLLDALCAKYAVLTAGIKEQRQDEVEWTFGTPSEMRRLARQYRAYGNRINSTKGIVWVIGKTYA